MNSWRMREVIAFCDQHGVSLYFEDDLRRYQRVFVMRRDGLAVARRVDLDALQTLLIGPFLRGMYNDLLEAAGKETDL